MLRCRFCGCTNNDACVVRTDDWGRPAATCYWTETDPPLCSECDSETSELSNKIFPDTPQEVATFEMVRRLFGQLHNDFMLPLEGFDISHGDAPELVVPRLEDPDLLSLVARDHENFERSKSDYPSRDFTNEVWARFAREVRELDGPNPFADPIFDVLEELDD